MNRRLLSLIVVLVVAWCLGPIGGQAQTFTQRGDDLQVTIERAFDVTPSGTLRIDRVVGSITVSTWSQNRVSVTESIRLDDYSREEAEEYVQEHGSTMEQRGNTVIVRGPARSSWNWRDDGQHAFTVQVPQRFDADVSTAGGSIDVEGLEGRVDANTSGGSIRVSEVTGEVDVNTSGGPLNLVSIDGPVSGNTSGGTIEVEQVSGLVDVRTSGGSLRIRDVQSDVDATTSGGSVAIEEVRGAVRARTSGGEMELRGIDNDVSAQTSGGDIEIIDIGGRSEVRTSGGDIEGRDLRGAVRAETSAGDIELDAVQAGVEARTSVGDIRVELTVDDFDVDYATRLSTSHGDITLGLPANLPATIQAEVRPLFRWDQDDILSDFPLTRTTPDDDRSSTLRSEGEINGGGPTIDLRTSGGSIRIEQNQ